MLVSCEIGICKESTVKKKIMWFGPLWFTSMEKGVEILYILRLPIRKILPKLNQQVKEEFST